VKEFAVGEGTLNLPSCKQDKMHTSGFIGSFCGSIFIGALPIPREVECLTNGLDLQIKHSKLLLKRK
jgi:hypothetical protein